MYYFDEIERYSRNNTGIAFFIGMAFEYSQAWSYGDWNEWSLLCSACIKWKDLDKDNTKSSPSSKEDFVSDLYCTLRGEEKKKRESLPGRTLPSEPPKKRESSPGRTLPSEPPKKRVSSPGRTLPESMCYEDHTDNIKRQYTRFGSTEREVAQIRTGLRAKVEHDG